MEYKVITSEEEFLCERENWNFLYNAIEDATPFQTFEWNYYWWKERETTDSLFIIKAYEGKDVWGYAPLVAKKGYVEFIGGRDMDYGRFIVNFKLIPIINGFVEVILEAGYDIRLQELSARNEQLHILTKILEQKKHYYIRRTTRTVNIKVKKYGSLENYRKCLTKNAKNSIRQMTKKAEKNEIIVAKEQISDATLKEIEEIFYDRQKLRGGSAEIEWAFPIIKDLSLEGLLSVYMVRQSGAAIAFMIVLHGKQGYYTWLMAFIEEARNLGAGQLLNYQIILDSYEHKYSKLDFMRGDYDFKMRWECEIDTNYTIYLYSNIFKYVYEKSYWETRSCVKRIVYSNEKLLNIYRKIRN